MNALTQIDQNTSLPVMIDRAAAALTNARTSAEVLDARDMAAIAYDVAKRTARLARAKDAHDSLVSAAHRAQADALEIEAGAKRRLADEYDLAQAAGEVGQSGARTDLVPKGNEVTPTAADLGLTRKDIHEARTFRDAEIAEPGVTKRTVTELLDTGHEPTKTALRQALSEAAARGIRGGGSPSRKNPHFVPDPLSDDMNRVVGCCATISEVMGRRTAAELLSACINDGERARVIEKIMAGATAIAPFNEERADAQ